MKEDTTRCDHRARLRAVLGLITLILALVVAACGDEEPTGPGNHAPVIQAQRDTSVVMGDTLRLTAHADDLDGDDLRYGFTVFVTLQEILSGYVPMAEMDHVTGEFKFVGQDADRPSRAVRFQVEDGNGGADSTRFSIAVN